MEFIGKCAFQKCNLKEGPFCYFINKVPKGEIIDLYKGEKNIDDLYEYLSNTTREHKNLEKKSEYKYEMALALDITFESFNERAKNNDQLYYDSLQRFDFNPGMVTFNVEGKFRIANKDEKINNERISSTPEKSYGITETEVTFKSEQEFTIISMFVRCAEENIKKETLPLRIPVYNKNDKILYYLTVRSGLKCADGNHWVQMIGDKKIKVNSFLLPKGIELDNINLVFTDDKLTKEQINEEFKKHYANMNENFQDKIDKAAEEIRKKGSGEKTFKVKNDN